MFRSAFALLSLTVAFAITACGSPSGGLAFRGAHTALEPAATGVAAPAESPRVVQDQRAWIALPPDRGQMQNCVVLIDVARGGTPCADRGGLADPVLMALPVPDGSALIKLMIYPKLDIAASYQLWRVDLSTRRESLLDAWDQTDRLADTYGKRMSISPDGRQVALIRQAAKIEGGSPAFGVSQGEVEVLDIASKASRGTGIQALDGHPVQWLDARRIVVSRIVPRQQVPAGLLPADVAVDDFGALHARSATVPVVYLHDLESGHAQPLHVGRIAVASPDGRWLIVQDDDRRLRRVDLSGSTVSSTPLAAPPGLAFRGVIGFTGPDHLLYWAPPDASQPVRETRFNSPLVGPKPLLSLRIADLRTGAFATVVNRIDPRSRPAVVVRR